MKKTSMIISVTVRVCKHESERIRWKSADFHRLQGGFSLVELLVVITIISILMALLLPAVQAAREAARHMQCSNNMKQLGLAMLSHEQANGFLPTGGWGWCWVGDPDRGFTKRQPGGWTYNLLPYIDQQPLHDLGSGQSNSAKALAVVTLVRTPLSVLNCPTRRPAKLYPKVVNDHFISFNVGPVYNTDPNLVARSDYVANGGNSYVLCTGGPGSLESGDSPNYPWYPSSRFNGVVFERSQITMADIRDGTSNTLLCGEKFVAADHYDTGFSGTHSGWVHIGHCADSCRWTLVDYPPLQDQEGNHGNFFFGSAHSSGFNVTFCDGSVHQISYLIDPTLFSYFGGRDDGEIVDGSKF